MINGNNPERNPICNNTKINNIIQRKANRGNRSKIITLAIIESITV